jgi:malonyl CoA-acyl carrier protein transacylase
MIQGFDISKIMFEGTAEELKETKATQPAVFLHSVILGSGARKNAQRHRQLSRYAIPVKIPN